MDSVDIEVLRTAGRWTANGHRVLLVTVVRTWGSSPRPPGAMLAVRDDGQVVGSVSGGCIEDDLVGRVRAGGVAALRPEVVTYGVSADEARRFGLPCGGTIQLVQEPLRPGAPLAGLLQAIEEGRLVARRLDLASGESEVLPADRSASLAFDGQVLVTVHGPRYRMLVIGASQLSKYLAQIAVGLDYRGDRLRPPRGVRRGVGRARRDAGDDDARRHRARDEARRALRGRRADARSQARRPGVARGAEVAGILRRCAGVARQQREAPRATAAFDLSDGEIARLHGPVGLYIGSRTPPEIAVSILAEITAVKNGVCQRRTSSASTAAKANAGPARSPAHDELTGPCRAGDRQPGEAPSMARGRHRVRVRLFSRGKRRWRGIDSEGGWRVRAAPEVAGEQGARGRLPPPAGVRSRGFDRRHGPGGGAATAAAAPRGESRERRAVADRPLLLADQLYTVHFHPDPDHVNQQNLLNVDYRLTHLGGGTVACRRRDLQELLRAAVAVRLRRLARAPVRERAAVLLQDHRRGAARLQGALRRQDSVQRFGRRAGNRSVRRLLLQPILPECPLRHRRCDADCGRHAALKPWSGVSCAAGAGCRRTRPRPCRRCCRCRSSAPSRRSAADPRRTPRDSRRRCRARRQCQGPARASPDSTTIIRTRSVYGIGDHGARRRAGVPDVVERRVRRVLAVEQPSRRVLGALGERQAFRRVAERDVDPRRVVVTAPCG